MAGVAMSPIFYKTLASFLLGSSCLLTLEDRSVCGPLCGGVRCARNSVQPKACTYEIQV